MSEVLVTGFNGFIGVNLIEYLTNNGLKSVKVNLRNTFSQWPDISNVKSFVHLAGKAHDLKNVSNDAEYFEVNVELTKKVFKEFLLSNAETFIFISSVKAAADSLNDILTEHHIETPKTAYGKSKLEAEKFLISHLPIIGKSIFILRPCMIHGPGNKGNLNLLYKLVSMGFPWPLGSFENKRSFCSIDNLMYIIKELIEREDIPSGIYNVADDISLSTNEVISILAESQNKNPKIWKVSKGLIQFIAKIGNLLKLPINEERLQKLTNSYIVCNKKIKLVIGKPLPDSSKEGLLKTFKSFNK